MQDDDQRDGRILRLDGPDGALSRLLRELLGPRQDEAVPPAIADLAEALASALEDVADARVREASRDATVPADVPGTSEP